MANFVKLNLRRPYKAMYSSLFGGVVTDVSVMMVPIDDHMVHRGDGVFEAIRVTPKKIYLLKSHLERLFTSAKSIGLEVPWSLSELASLCEGVCEVARKTNDGFTHGLLRVFVSRGPGDFSPNPYTTIGSQLYIVATEFTPPAEEKYEKGVTLGVSQIPVKPSFYSQVKSCNYLPNVMMKKEAVDRKLDFVINLYNDKYVAEGPTENILILNNINELVAPKFDYTLKGTTLVRAMWYAKNKMQNMIVDVRSDNISLEDLRHAKEIMMVGTTLGVLPVTTLEEVVVGDGQVGPVTRSLHDWIAYDQLLSSD